MNVRFLAYALAAMIAIGAIYLAYDSISNYYPPAEKKVVVLGFDGMDSDLAEKWMDEGKLPNLARLRSQGTYSPLRTTTPADTPVAWTTAATGLNPGRHNVLDFLDRDPETYMPRISIIKKEEVEGGKPIVYNTKNGTSIWETISDNGGWSSIITYPVTFPAEDFRGHMISGLGTPDIRATWGTFNIYAEDAPEAETLMGGNFIPVHFEGDSAQALLYGPQGYTINMTITRTSFNSVTLSFGGREYELREGEWSDWADFSFDVHPIIKLKGSARFYLVDADPLYLYLQPVSMDPREPFFRISTPEGYSADVAQELGMYKTVGWADDTWALNDEAIDEAVFLQDAYRTLEHKEKLVLEEMEKEPDLLMVVFYQTDTLQHTFYRYMDPENPNYYYIPEDEREKHEGEILRIYQRMDEVLGKVMEKADDDTTIIVMSDHGFNPFRYAVNLNTWLYENGYLTKKPGADTQYYKLNSLYGEKGLFWNDVLLNETQAYSLGLGNIYINREGRESQGTVSEEEYDALRDEIAEKLLKLRDPATGQRIIAKVQKREDIYHGAYTDHAADLIISFNPGYRVSWQTSLGGVPPEIVEPNWKKWSGDHCTLDPDQTTGVFFTNRVIDLEWTPALRDINPTLRDLLGLPEDTTLDGHSLLRPKPEEPELEPEAGAKVTLPDTTGYNILFITIDCTRADYVSAYNENSLANTTNIDALAAKGFLFENAHTAFTFTCPSHSIMMTGRYYGGGSIAARSGDNLLNLLNESGYSTGATVGFGGLSLHACATGPMFEDYDSSAVGYPLGTRGGMSANYTIDWIRNHSDGKFFFWMHLYDAHPPGIGASRNVTENYALSVEYVDGQVGRVLQTLKDEGIEGKTIVVLLSDHGMGDDFGNIPENRKLYDTATHVPYVIYVPGAEPQGNRLTTLASTVDLAPTLAQLMGMGYNNTYGVSLFDSMEAPEKEVRSEVFSSYRFGGLSQDMARTYEWKYILSQPLGPRSDQLSPYVELYNVMEDPDEQYNVSGSEYSMLTYLDAMLAGYIAILQSAQFPQQQWIGAGQFGTGGTYDDWQQQHGAQDAGSGEGTAPEIPEPPPAYGAPGWYGGYGYDGTPLDNETLEELRSFGYIN